MENRTSSLIETPTTSRGCCFRDIEELKVSIQIHVATVGDRTSVDSVESELLLNADLKSIGGKSLPIDLKRSSHLQGPKVLQVVSVSDLYQSSIEASARGLHSFRLLRIGLTDGHSEVVAIEYSSIHFIVDDIVPGTKVHLEDRAAVHNGIVCLNPKAITVLGGVVPSVVTL